MTLTLAEIFREYETDGVPASGPHKIVKADMRAWGVAFEGALFGGASAIFTTLASANAHLAYDAFTLGWVVADGANNGIYQKQLASGSGSWTKLANLPYSFERATNAGAGSANAIVATTSRPVSSETFIAVPVTHANTSGTVTVNFNATTDLLIRTSRNETPPIGSLVPGMILAGYIDGGSFFRLITDFTTFALDTVGASAEAYGFTFDTATGISDPGPGKLRLNAATQYQATHVVVDDTSLRGEGLSAILMSMGSSTSATKGVIRIVAATDITRFLQFTFSAVVDPIGYKNFTVTFVGPPAAILTNPFVNGERVVLIVSRTGDQGEQGTQGLTGPQGIPGLTNYQGVWSGVTTYALAHTVQRGSGYYISQAAGNINHDPATDTANTWWAPIMAHRPTMTIGRVGTRGQYFCDYLCTGTNDHTVINAAAIALHATGGGTLKILAGVYDIGNGGIELRLLSNIIVEGEGRGATILKKSAAFTTGAGLRFRACTNCHAVNLTVESDGRVGNGIEFIPDNMVDTSGTTCKDVSAVGCHVTLQPEQHRYAIWFMKAVGFLATKNLVDGKSVDLTAAGQEGIECYAGKHGRVFGNHVCNMAGTAYDIVNTITTTNDGGCQNVEYFGNTADRVNTFLWVAACYDAVNGAGHLINVSMHGNVGRRIFKQGISITNSFGNALDTTFLRNVSLRGNLCEMAGVDDGADPTDAFGLLATNQDSYVPRSGAVNVKNFVVSGNQFLNCPNNAFLGAVHVGIEDITIENNDIHHADAAGPTGSRGVVLVGAPGTRVIGNRVHGAGQNAIEVTVGCDDAIIQRNDIQRSNQDATGAPPIVVADSDRIVVTDNVCSVLNVVSMPALVALSGVDGFNVERNITPDTGYAGSELQDGGSTNGNRGSFTRSGGFGFKVISTSRCRPDSMVDLMQTGGAISVLASIVPGNGSFLITWSTAGDGATFNWRVR